MREVLRYLSLQSLTMAVVLTLMVGASCASRTARPPLAPMPRIPARDLLLDDQAFPEDWDVHPCEPDCRRLEGATHAERSLYIIGVPGHAIQDVSRLESVEAARAKFQTYRRVVFRKKLPPQVPSSEFLPPPEIHYRSRIADDYYFGCGVDIVPACRAIARYGQYFVYFFFNVDRGAADGEIIESEGLKIEEVEPILRALDERVATRLGILLPAPSPIPHPAGG